MTTKEKKRHHFVPKAYLRAFCDASGKFWVFPKDNPGKPFHVNPDGIAHERYYYSQPLPDGGQDNNQLEDLFGKLESKWPPIVARWQKGDPANNMLECIFEFIALMRARVPAARDITEACLANVVKTTMRRMNKSGKLPPPPPGFEDLPDKIEVSIDPHQSIHAMARHVKGLGQVFDAIGLEVIRNDTATSFLTSDNPVAYFDPDVSEAAFLPYNVNLPGGRIELIFSVAPNLLLRGHSDLKPRFAVHGLQHRLASDRQEVKRYNRLISRFGYRFVFSWDRTNDPVILKYAHVSPVPDFQNIAVGNGEFGLSQLIFGKRKPKPKWIGARNYGDIET